MHATTLTCLHTHKLQLKGNPRTLCALDRILGVEEDKCLDSALAEDGAEAARESKGEGDGGGVDNNAKATENEDEEEEKEKEDDMLLVCDMCGKTPDVEVSNESKSESFFEYGVLCMYRLFLFINFHCNASLGNCKDCKPTCLPHTSRTRVDVMKTNRHDYSPPRISSASYAHNPSRTTYGLCSLVCWATAACFVSASAEFPAYIFIVTLCLSCPPVDRLRLRVGPRSSSFFGSLVPHFPL